jgi:hypothetical protein
MEVTLDIDQVDGHLEVQDLVVDPLVEVVEVLVVVVGN